MDATDAWTTATDLAEYTYCPRAHHYRRRFGQPPPTEAARAGVVFHARRLGATRRREDHPGLPWGLLLAGVVLAVAGGVTLLR